MAGQELRNARLDVKETIRAGYVNKIEVKDGLIKTGLLDVVRSSEMAGEELIQLAGRTMEPSDGQLRAEKGYLDQKESTDGRTQQGAQ